MDFKRRPIVSKFAGAVFSQGILSLTNFFVGIIVARYAVKTEYAIYVILFSIIGIAQLFQNVLVNTPAIVLAPAKEPTERRIFFSGLAAAQCIIFLACMMLTAMVIAFHWIINGELGIGKYGLVLVFSCMALMAREYIRALNYIYMKVYKIIKMDIIFVLSVAGGLLALFLYESVTSCLSVTILGIGYLTAFIFGYYEFHEKFKLNFRVLSSSVRETWRFSKWAIISIFAVIGQNRAFIYIASGILGLQEVANISATRLLLMPLGLFIASSGNITLAKGADLLVKNDSTKFVKLFTSIILFFVCLWSIYVLILWLLHDTLISYGPGEKYLNLEGYITLWSVYFFIQMVRFPINRALMALKEFKILARYDAISGITTVIVCLALSKIIGGKGAIISLIAGEFTLFALVIYRASNYFRAHANSGFFQNKSLAQTDNTFTHQPSLKNRKI